MEEEEDKSEMIMIIMPRERERQGKRERERERRRRDNGRRKEREQKVLKYMLVCLLYVVYYTPARCMQILASFISPPLLPAISHCTVLCVYCVEGASFRCSPF